MPLDLPALADLEKLEKEATVGPWEFRATNDSGGIRFVVAPNAGRTTQGFEFIPADCSHGYNGRLIAALRTAAPELLRLAKEAFAARAFIPEWADMLNDLDVERCNWREDYASYRALVSEHQKGSGG